MAGATRSPVTLLTDVTGRMRWLPIAASFALGAWLIVSPGVLGYAEHPQAISDRCSGAIIVLLALAATATRKPVVIWFAGGIGMWLIASPIVLWAPTLSSYANPTLVGIVATTAAFIVPVTRALPGAEIPTGWSYNPSAWSQRAPVILLSVVAFAPALYMAAFQLGYLETVGDPFFDDGTRRVLTSRVSQMFPVSDAGLGAAMYLIDLVMTCAGDRRRWRTMPWLVIVFGILIVPVGVVSVVLVMLQPIAVGAWCTWCLLTAIATLAMVPLAIDEVAATLQLLRRTARSGRSWTHVLWRGDAKGATDQPAPVRPTPTRVPRGLVIAAGAGLWLVLEPYALGTSGAHAASTMITGTLAIVVAAVAASELARSARIAFVPIGLWAALAPWVLSGVPTAHLSGPLAGILLIGVSLLRGPLRQRHAELDRVAYWPGRRSLARSQ